MLHTATTGKQKEKEPFITSSEITLELGRAPGNPLHAESQVGRVLPSSGRSFKWFVFLMLLVFRPIFAFLYHDLFPILEQAGRILEGFCSIVGTNCLRPNNA